MRFGPQGMGPEVLGVGPDGDGLLGTEGLTAMASHALREIHHRPVLPGDGLEPALLHAALAAAAALGVVLPQEVARPVDGRARRAVAPRRQAGGGGAEFGVLIG